MTKRTYKPNSISSKDRFREIEAFDVGFNIEKQIEEDRKKAEAAIEIEFEEISESDNIKKERKPIKPHMRKAHWHHFWTGSKEDPDNRQLVVRWVPPTFVKPRNNK